MFKYSSKYFRKKFLWLILLTQSSSIIETFFCLVSFGVLLPMADIQQTYPSKFSPF